MLQIQCPYCGLRDETEFVCGGECLPPRPVRPDELDDAAWASFLFERHNRKGLQVERWQHRFGCRRWFQVRRDTVSHQIETVDPAPVPHRGWSSGSDADIPAISQPGTGEERPA